MDSSGDDPRWGLVRVVHMPRLSDWSPSPFYDSDPHVRLQGAIDEWNEVADLIFNREPERDFSEELILAESIWWDWFGRIQTLKSIYRAESEGGGDFDEALRLTFTEAYQAVFDDIQKAMRMLKYHEDDDFFEIYTQLHDGLKALRDQFRHERDLWNSRTGR